MQQTLHPEELLMEQMRQESLLGGKHVQISVALALAQTSWCTEERRSFVVAFLKFYLTSFSSLSKLESHKGSTFGHYLRRLCNIFNYWRSYGVEELPLSNKSHDVL